MTITVARYWLPGDTPIWCDRYGTAHRWTSHGPPCGSGGRTRRSTVNAAVGFHLDACTDPRCWGGGRPW